MKVYCFDIDNTVCSAVENSNYHLAKPFPHAVRIVNQLFDQGNKILFYTARGVNSKVDHTQLTKKQLKDWGFKFHELVMHRKPHADFFIDDKALKASDFFSSTLVRGFIAGMFDILHPGYFSAFEECKMHCTHLTVALHEDPSIERQNKRHPIFSLKERKKALSAISFIDEVLAYKTETDLINLLKRLRPDVRFLGEDYKGKFFTGCDLTSRTVFLNRNHQWSYTKVLSALNKN